MATTRVDLHAYDIAAVGDTLTIVIRKEFDFGSLHQNWAHAIITLHPGPYQRVALDMTATGIVSSTFFAGLMQLHFHYTQGDTKAIELFKPDPRMVRNLTIMRMHTMFTIIPR